jgi:hypothetical protein
MWCCVVSVWCTAGFSVMVSHSSLPGLVPHSGQSPTATLATWLAQQLTHHASACQHVMCHMCLMSMRLSWPANAEGWGAGLHARLSISSSCGMPFHGALAEVEVPESKCDSELTLDFVQPNTGESCDAACGRLGDLSGGIECPWHALTGGSPGNDMCLARMKLVAVQGSETRDAKLEVFAAGMWLTMRRGPALCGQQTSDAARGSESICHCRARHAVPPGGLFFCIILQPMLCWLAVLALLAPYRE